MVMTSRGGKTRVAKGHAPTTMKSTYKSNKDDDRALKSATSTTKSNGKQDVKKVAKSSSVDASASTNGIKRKRYDADNSIVATIKPSNKLTNENAATSLLNLPDEIDFVRGGGTNLTQVEVKEAQLEGVNEAKLAEHDDSLPDGKKDKGKAKRRKLERALVHSSVKDKNALPKDAFRVEHLNYKRLVPGTKVLGQIVSVRPLELILSLPNQLFAHVPITNISPEYTARLETMNEEDETSDEDDDAADERNSEGEDDGSSSEASVSSGLPTLAHWFRPGQFVSAVVVASKGPESRDRTSGREPDENVRASRRIEMSLEPQKVNDGIAKGDLKTGFTLTASVKSAEDRGYILSLGLDSMTSFLSFKDAAKYQSSKLSVGQLIPCRIKEVSENGRTCNVTVGSAEVTGSTLTTATSINSILPSTLLTALVTATLPSGLNVKFFGFFDGTIDLFHLDGRDPENDFKVGQKVKARVLWDSIGTTPKRFALSLARHVVELGIASLGGDAVKAPLEDEFPVGRILDQVKVVRMDDEWGLTCEYEQPGTRVLTFAHISKLTDDHLASIPKNGPWKVGTLHRARVIGYSALDGLVQISLQQSVLEQAFLRVSDVKVGEIIKGTIKRLSDSALFVSISGSVDGVVWPLHYSDIKLKHPEKKFKAGASVKARILSADAEKNRVVLTLKRQLINSELSVIKNIADAQVGVDTHATVSRVLDTAILVDFFGGVRALVPATEVAEEFTSDLGKIFTVGKVIVVRIIRVDKKTGKVTASVRQAQSKDTVSNKSQASSSTSSFGSVESISIGSIVTGEVVQLHDTNIVLKLQPGNVKALISFATLARHRHIDVDALRADLQKGDSLEKLVVVSKNVEKAFVVVGLVPNKPKKSEESVAESRNVTFESLELGQQLSGRISGKIPTGLLVQLSRTVRARVPRMEISDDYDHLDSKETAIGATVRCVVLKIDNEHRRADLSLRASRRDSSIDPKDAVIDSLDDLKVGQSVRGFVKNIASQGLFVSLSDQITARVLIKELFDAFVKEWKGKFNLGQLVYGKITAIDKVNDKVEMSLRTKPVESKKATLDVSSLEKGQVVAGIVKRLEAFGAFIAIQGTTVNGLCHKSKVSDEEGKPWNQLIKEGDKVKAIVLDVNQETKKVSLGLKKSLFPENALSDSEDGEEEDESDSDGDDDNDDDDDEVEEGTDNDGEEVEDSADDDEVTDSNEVGGDAESDDDDAQLEAPFASTSKAVDVLKAKVAPLQVGAGFDWGGGEESDSDEAGTGAADDSESSDDEEEVIEAVVATSKSSKASNGHETLDDRTGSLDEQTPTSVADFERLLLGSPNSSFLWIQYIAFFVSLSQLEKARSIGQRAIKTINFREEQEKLNVWVALLNLENSYGTETELDTLFKEATQANDSKTIHLRLIDIYNRSGKFAAEEQLFKRLVKKFSHSSKAWTLFAQFYLTQSRPEEAHDLLPRSLKSLEKRKHVKTITKFAQLEFKLGDPERGRTIFEGIVDNYTKRLDLWLVYIDMEIKQRNIAGVRALFDRLIAGKLSSKKGKSVFKKWLAFEKELGDEKGVDAVKTKALAFVETLNR